MQEMENIQPMSLEEAQSYAGEIVQAVQEQCQAVTNEREVITNLPDVMRKSPTSKEDLVSKYVQYFKDVVLSGQS